MSFCSYQLMLRQRYVLLNDLTSFQSGDPLLDNSVYSSVLVKDFKKNNVAMTWMSENIARKRSQSTDMGFL